jgi:peptidoglycan glycosyltransferase
VNRAISRVGIAVVVLLLVLAGQLTYLQVVDAKKLKDDKRNSRTFLKDFTRARGQILSAEGAVLAKSVPSDDEYERQREYPTGELFAQTVGYQSVVVGSTGVENYYNSTLVGSEFKDVRLKDVRDILLDKDQTGTVVLTMRADVQLVAKQALGDQKGSVVVLDPRTGGIIALYSNPSFDPNPLTGHKTKSVQAWYNALNANPENPSLPRAYRERYAPGSTFKIVTSTASIDAGLAPPDRVFPTRREFLPPQASRPIRNFGGESCGGTLEQSLVESCNSTFAQLGLELGENFVPAMQAFGIGSTPPLDVRPGAVESVGPPAGSFEQNKPFFSLAGIGQGQVAATPLQMALVGAAVANGGIIMAPHVAGEIRDAEGKTIRTIADEQWKQAMPATTAATVRDYMVQVVEHGTGTAARIPGVTVAGKTGTAECGDNCKPHAWFVTFAPAEAPQFVVAVLVEHGGNYGSEATGGRVAAPIAARLLKYLLGK